MTRVLIVVALLLAAWSASAQPNLVTAGDVPPAVTIANLPTAEANATRCLDTDQDGLHETCGEGAVRLVTDGVDATDCTVGGGSDLHPCFSCDAGWQDTQCGSPSGSATGDITAVGSGVDGCASGACFTSGVTQNRVFASPDGAPGAAGMRGLVAGDMPSDGYAGFYPGIGQAEVISGTWTIQGLFNFDGTPEGVLRLPTSATLPATCTLGEAYIDSDADTDGSLYICIAANTWKDVDDDGSSSGGVSDGDKGDITVSGGGSTWDVDSGAVAATELSGNLPTSKLNSGTGATAVTFWRGDGTWNVIDSILSIASAIKTHGSGSKLAVTSGAASGLLNTDDGTPNQSTDPVHWSRIWGIPTVVDGSYAAATGSDWTDMDQSEPTTISGALDTLAAVSRDVWLEKIHGRWEYVNLGESKTWPSACIGGTDQGLKCGGWNGLSSCGGGGTCTQASNIWEAQQFALNDYIAERGDALYIVDIVGSNESSQSNHGQLAPQGHVNGGSIPSAGSRIFNVGVKIAPTDTAGFGGFDANGYPITSDDGDGFSHQRTNAKLMLSTRADVWFDQDAVAPQDPAVLYMAGDSYLQGTAGGVVEFMWDDRMYVTYTGTLPLGQCSDSSLCFSDGDCTGTCDDQRQVRTSTVVDPPVPTWIHETDFVRTRLTDGTVVRSIGTTVALFINGWVSEGSEHLGFSCDGPFLDSSLVNDSDDICILWTESQQRRFTGGFIRRMGTGVQLYGNTVGSFDGYYITDNAHGVMWGHPVNGGDEIFYDGCAQGDTDGDGAVDVSANCDNEDDEARGLALHDTVVEANRYGNVALFDWGDRNTCDHCQTEGRVYGHGLLFGGGACTTVDSNEKLGRVCGEDTDCGSGGVCTPPTNREGRYFVIRDSKGAAYTNGSTFEHVFVGKGATDPAGAIKIEGPWEGVRWDRDNDDDFTDDTTAFAFGFDSATHTDAGSMVLVDVSDMHRLLNGFRLPPYPNLYHSGMQQVRGWIDDGTIAASERVNLTPLSGEQSLGASVSGGGSESTFWKLDQFEWEAWSLSAFVRSLDHTLPEDCEVRVVKCPNSATNGGGCLTSIPDVTTPYTHTRTVDIGDGTLDEAGEMQTVYLSEPLDQLGGFALQLFDDSGNGCLTPAAGTAGMDVELGVTLIPVKRSGSGTRTVTP